MRPSAPNADSLCMAERSGALLVADLLKHGHAVRVTVGGASMSPTIEDGERVHITPLDPAATVRRGDIVWVLGRDGGALLHRVVRVLDDGRIQTRGDGHWRLDDPVPVEAVLGMLRTQPHGPGNRRSPWRALIAACRHWQRMAQSWWGYRRQRAFRAPGR